MALSTLEKVGLGALAFFALKMLGGMNAKADEPDEEEKSRGLLMLERVPAYATTAHPQDVRAALYNEWTNLHGGNNPSDEIVAMMLAHSALETGHWKKMWNWNPVNLTVNSGKYYVNPGKGQEKYKYAAFDSLEAGAREYIAYMKRRQKPAYDLLASGNPESFAARLKEGGFYEADEKRYADTLTPLYKQFFDAIAKRE